MTKGKTGSTPEIWEGAQQGLRMSVYKAFADVPSEPLPFAQVELLLALRQREREQVDPQTSRAWSREVARA